MPTLQEELKKIGLVAERKEVREEDKFEFYGYLDKEVVNDFEKNVSTTTKSIYHAVKTKMPFRRRASNLKVWEGHMRHPAREDTQFALTLKTLKLQKNLTVPALTEVLKVHFPNMSSVSAGTLLSKLALAEVVRKEYKFEEGKKHVVYTLIDDGISLEVAAVKYSDRMRASKGARKNNDKKPIVSKHKKATTIDHTTYIGDIGPQTPILDTRPIRDVVGTGIGTKIVEDVLKKIVIEVVGKIDVVFKFEH